MFFVLTYVKGTVLHFKKAPINDRWRISKVYRKFHIPTIFNILQ